MWQTFPVLAALLVKLPQALEIAVSAEGSVNGNTMSEHSVTHGNAQDAVALTNDKRRQHCAPDLSWDSSLAQNMADFLAATGPSQFMIHLRILRESVKTSL